MRWTWWSLGNRPVVFPVVAVVLGVTVGPWVAWPWWVWCAGFLASLAGAFLRGRRAGAVFFGLLAACCLGAFVAELHVDVVPPRIGARALVEAEVERVAPHGFGVNVTAVDGVPSRFRAMLATDAPSQLLPGQRVLVETAFRWVQPAANPGEWSRSAWAWRRGQPVTGSIKNDRVVVLTAPSVWQRWLNASHRALVSRVYELTDNEAAGALLLTLAAGERAELGDAMEDTFARSGLAHVLSVSGLHVAVLAFSLFAALRWLLSRRMVLRRIEPRALAAPLAVPLVWAYVWFTGWQGPAVRSALMCMLVLLAHTLRRRSDPLNAIALAALAIVVVEPSAPFELSMQLSFIAVLALVLLAPLLRAALPVPLPSPSTQSGWALQLARWREAAVQTFAASVAVTLASGPLIAHAFQRVSFAGLVSNVVTLPLSGLLTLVAALGAALHVTLPSLATPVLWLGAQLSRLFIALAEFFADVPGATGEVATPSLWIMSGWWLGLALLVLTRGRWKVLALAAPTALLLHTLGPREAPLTVTFLSVGHGDAIVVSSRERHVLIDGGGVPNGSDPGRRVVLPYLRQRGIRELELVVLSHAHPDHALGLISVLDEVPTREVWLHDGSEEGELTDALLTAAGDARVALKAAGDAPIELGEISIEVLGPSRGTDLETENDLSLVLLLRHGDVSFLLTGDLEAAGEAALTFPRATVVKAPHHGSDTSSTQRFVDETRPQHVVFSVGRNNRFNFPRPSVVQRWEASGAQTHRTDEAGAITFTSDGQYVEVETFLTPRVHARSAPLLTSPRSAGGGNALPLPAKRGEGRGEGP